MDTRSKADCPTAACDVVLAASWADGRPLLRRRRSTSKPESVEARGLALAYRTDTRPIRHCLGSRHRSDDCRQHVQAGSRRCAGCSIAEALHASSLHHAHTRDRADIDPDVRHHLAQPNELYLAGFRDGSVKVGTSSAWRTSQRLTEQGAWRALIMVETDDGYRVRELEDAVTERLGIAQSVATARKIRGLTNPIDDEALATRLAAAADDVAALAAVAAVNADTDHRRVWINPAAESGPFTGRLQPYPNRIDLGAHDFVIEDMCGRVAAIRPAKTDQVLAVDLGPLFGVAYEPGHFATDEIALQGSLF